MFTAFLNNMEILNGIILKEFPLVENMVRIGDLVNFEGPLLTLFEDCRNNRLYIFDWVDRDEDKNRWIVYRASPFFLKQFITGKISHKELFLSSVDGYYSLEINRKLQYENFRKLSRRDIPDEYLPQDDAFFEDGDCPHLPRIKAKINSLIKLNFIVHPIHKVSDSLNTTPKDWHYTQKASLVLFIEAQADQTAFMNSISPQIYSKTNRYA
jgi:hypothetical protein